MSLDRIFASYDYISFLTLCHTILPTVRDERGKVLISENRTRESLFQPNYDQGFPVREIFMEIVRHIDTDFEPHLVDRIRQLVATRAIDISIGWIALRAVSMTRESFPSSFSTKSVHNG